MARLAITLLGDFRIEANGSRPVDPPVGKTRALLAWLALQSGSRLGREAATGLLWADRQQKHANASLSQALYSLRKTLGEVGDDVLNADNEAIELPAEAAEVDAKRFSELARRRDFESLEAAEALYRGAFLDGFAPPTPEFDEWMQTERRRLDAEAVDALTTLLALRSERGDGAARKLTARRLLELDPYHEPAARALMHHYATRGRLGQASKVYERLRSVMAEDLGSEPSAKTTALCERILRHEITPDDPPLPAAEAGPATAAGAAPRRPARRTPRLVAAAVVLLVLAAGVAVWRISMPEFQPASVDRMAFELPDKPSIAVLPFANVGDDPEQVYFADGITNDLITDLSKFNSLFVIAANSTFTYKGKPVKVQQVAEDLGVRYVLEGSVQRTGDNIRINVQLVDALNGHHLWAERYDRKAEDLFAIQDEILKTIVGTLHVEVINAEFERTLKRPTENLSAYDYYQRGFYYHLAWGKENNDRARRSFKKAIELDPDYARAYAMLSFVETNDWQYDFAEDTSDSLAHALNDARKSVAIDPDDYWNIWALGHVRMARGETDEAIAAYQQALALNPNDPGLLMGMVELLVSVGQADQAVTQAKTAMRHNPHCPDWYFWNLGWAQYMAGQPEDAIATLQKMTNPPNGVRRTLAAALVEVGRIDEARAMIKEYMKNEPAQTVADIRKLKYKYRPYVDKWANDLLKAGLPE